MKKINFNNKMLCVFNQLVNYKDKGTLYDCYNNPSYNKEKAYNYCLDLKNKYTPFDFYSKYGFYSGVLGYNTCTFSYGFIGLYENKPAVFYITHCNDFVSIIPESYVKYLLQN